MDINDNEGYRVENKYYIPFNSIPIIKRRLEMFAEIDKNARAGYYTVSSIYFDDICDNAMEENEDGIDPRSKWRIRIYNHDYSRITLENKIKRNGLTKKESTEIGVEQYRYLIGEKRNSGIAISNHNALYDYFCIEKNIHFMTPKVIVEYERIPYVYNFNTTRITIDYNISCIDDIASFGRKEVQRYSLLNRDLALMEVKYNGLLPDFIVHTIQEFGMHKTANSKYYLSRISKYDRAGV